VHKLQYGEIAVTLLNLDDVRGTQACLGGKGLLGETLLLSVLTDSRSKKLKQCGRIVWLQGGHSVTHSYRVLSPPGGWRITRDGRSEGSMGVQPCEQPGGWNTQDRRETQQCQHRNIALPQFDIADIRAAYACARGERLLRQALLLPVLPEGRPKTLQRCVVQA